MDARRREYGTGDRSTWVLLHGWGFDGAVMEPLARRLAGRGRVLVPDLPGFAPADTQPPGIDVDALADAVARSAPAGARWLGWSLGGLVALSVARRYPQRVRGVDLLASTPRFVAATDWPGIAPEALADFSAGVDADPVAAHRRFLAFQLAGSEGARPLLRQLRDLAERRGLPSQRALADGLSILRQCDLRQQLSALSCPVRALLGRADPLVPAALEPQLSELGVEVRVIEGAGHVPFLSHPGVVREALEQSMCCR